MVVTTIGPIPGGKGKYGAAVEKATAHQTTAFSATQNQDILLANTLGIVNGSGSGKFSPNNYITRQKAVAMLYRTSKVIDADTKSEVGIRQLLFGLLTTL